MGCGWLCDHFTSVFNNLYEIHKDIWMLQTTVTVLMILQLTLSGFILWLLLK